MMSDVRDNRALARVLARMSSMRRSDSLIGLAETQTVLQHYAICCTL